MKSKLILCVVLIIVASFSICYAKTFKDVSSDHWAYKYIDKLSNDGVINGFEDGTFKPSETLTKAQFIKLVVLSNKFLGQKVSSSLTSTDTNRQWYESYFEVADAYKLLPNRYTKSNLNNSISRKDMAEILTKIIKFVSYLDTLSVEEQGKLKDNLAKNPNLIANAFSRQYMSGDELESGDTLFEDVLVLSEQDQDNVYIVKKLGIINGYDDGTFKPEGFVTRAEASKVLYVYNDLSAKGGQILSVNK